MQKTKTMNIAGFDVSVVKKSGIKNLNLRVCAPEGNVRVSAPFFVSDAQIIRFVESRTSFIERNQKRVRERARFESREYVSGETIYLWGVPLCLRVLRAVGTRCRIWVEGNTLFLEVPEGCTKEVREKKINEWYRAQLVCEIKRTAPAIEQKIGVHASEYRTKNMKTRWGTCNITQARIWINLQLAKRPPECLEYILVHELCHLIEKNHTKKFWMQVGRYCPEYKHAKQLLEEVPSS